MVIKWHPRALKMVRAIHRFYSSKDKKAADKIVKGIFDAVDKLATFPKMAPVEEMLVGFADEYRSLVVRKLFKVVYFINELTDEVVIVMVRDCRRNPEGLKDEISDN